MTQILTWGRTEIRPDHVLARLTRDGSGWNVTVRATGLDQLGAPPHARVSALLRHPARVSLPRIDLGALAGCVGGAAIGTLSLGELEHPDEFSVNLVVSDPETHEILARCFNVQAAVERGAGSAPASGARSFVSLAEEPSLDVPLRVECRPSGPTISWCRNPRGRALVFDAHAYLRDPLNRAVILPVAFETWVAHLLSCDGELTGTGWDALRRMLATLFGYPGWAEVLEIGREAPEEKAQMAAALLYRSGLSEALERAVKAAAETAEDEE